MDDLRRYLVEGRERAGKTPEQVSRETRVPNAAILALESGRIDDLPAVVYVRGFVVAYCKAVGLDSGPALDMIATVSRERRRAGPDRQAPEGHGGDLLVGRRRPASVSWSYIAIIMVFVVGIIVALLTVGTGGAPGDVSRAPLRDRGGFLWQGSAAPD